MANTYFVVFDQTIGTRGKPLTKHAETEYVTNPEESKYVKLEAENVAEAQRTVEHFYPGSITNTPVVVTEAEWSESESGGGTETYFVVFCQQKLSGHDIPAEPKVGLAGKILSEVTEATFISIEGKSRKEVRQAIYRHFPTDITNTPIVVKEGGWKTS